MKRNGVTWNMLVLTASGIVAKTIDFSFKAWYSSRLGEEGMGIFSLVMGIFGVVLNLSSAGMGTAVSRLCSMEQSRGNYGAVFQIAKTAVKIVAVGGILCCVIVFFAANQISTWYLKDIRCAKSLVCIVPSSVFMGISYCLKGYFYAKRQVLIPASSEFVEQGVKVAAISFLLNKGLAKGIEMGCAGVCLGLTAGEMCSCLYLGVWYLCEKKNEACEQSMILSIVQLTLPILLASVSSSALRTCEDIWVVRGFKKLGMGAENALGTYGLIQGMVMPLLVFPITLISSFMALLVPEISRAKENSRLEASVLKVYKTAWFFGGLVFCIFFLFSKEIAAAVYKTQRAASYLKILAVLCPLMIMDSISTGMMGGLGEQMKLMKYSLLDNGIRLFMVYFFLPVWGVGVVIAMIFLGNIMTCILTVRRVAQKAKIPMGKILAADRVASWVFTIIIIKILRPKQLDIMGFAVFLFLTAGIYTVLAIKNGHIPYGKCPKIGFVCFRAGRRNKEQQHLR